MPLNVAMSEVLWPIIKPLTVLLALPYAITRGIVPYLDLTAQHMQNLYTYGFAVEYLVLVVYFGTHHMVKGLQKLHNSIRDDRYLVGRQLNNFLSGHM